MIIEAVQRKQNDNRNIDVQNLNFISMLCCWLRFVETWITDCFIRYLQRFDPGFGFNGGPYTIQPMYSPTVNYNTEFPQLGSGHQPSISSEHHPRPIPQHLPGLWAPQSTPAGISYGHPDVMMTPYSHNHVGARSTSALYLHSAQYPCQHPGMPFINPREQVHQSFSQVWPCLSLLSLLLSKWIPS